MTEMARTHPENAPKNQSCPKTDATWKKEATTTKDNMAKDSTIRATRYGALVGRGSDRSKGQDAGEEHCCCSLLWDLYVVTL